MKNLPGHIGKTSFFVAVFLFLRLSSMAQGRVVVNEFMSWSGCSTTNEFIELLNFGPGPMNIGCYIVTNGNYAVTIPANTVLKPGQYYVISGQDLLAQNCGNVDSAITVDLNWNTCNCSDKPIPTTGDGFLKNGGGANEKIVLLDPNLNVVDAVSRSASISSSVPITTANTGSCASKTFDLSTMSISYETIGNSTGIDNSFARKVDGDCGWVKTTAISADAPNKTGNTGSASYTFTTVSASECAGTAGFVSIGVNAANLTSLFPMTYTLAYDADSNNTFDETDQYSYGMDAAPPAIDINNLDYGRYRITVGSSLGCNLQSFDFFIFNCYGVVLPVRPGEDKTPDDDRGQPHINKLWPNPASSQLFVQLNAANYGRVGYTIFNAAGIPMRKGRLDLRPGANTSTLRIDDLPPGFYLFKTTGSSNIAPVVLRFMKQ